MAKDSNTNICLKQGGDAFGFFDGTNEREVTALQMMQQLHAPTLCSTYTLSTASTQLASFNIDYRAKYIVFSITSNAANLSAWLTSNVSVGMELYLILRQGSTCASGSLLISCSGVSLVDHLGVTRTIMHLLGSAASWGRAHLVCTKDGEWSVMDVSSATSVTFS